MFVVDNVVAIPAGIYECITASIGVKDVVALAAVDGIVELSIGCIGHEDVASIRSPNPGLLLDSGAIPFFAVSKTNKFNPSACYIVVGATIEKV